MVEYGGFEGVGINLFSRDFDFGVGVGGSRGFVYVGLIENCSEFLLVLFCYDGLMRGKMYV